MIYHAMLGTGYVEDTGFGHLWVTIVYSKAISDKQFLEELRSTFEEYFNEFIMKKPKECCVNALKGTSRRGAKFCPICGRNLAELPVDEHERHEQIIQWFRNLVNGTYDSEGGAMMEWMEDHGVLLHSGLRSDNASKAKSTLFIIDGFDHFLAHDLTRCNASKSTVILTMNKVKL